MTAIDRICHWLIARMLPADQWLRVLRPRSVVNTDMALRLLAGFLVEIPPAVASVDKVTRRHVEDYRPWLAARPWQNTSRDTPATLAHQLGTPGWGIRTRRRRVHPGDSPLARAG
jgi:hypothetical protein